MSRVIPLLEKSGLLSFLCKAELVHNVDFVLKLEIQPVGTT